MQYDIDEHRKLIIDETGNTFSPDKFKEILSDLENEVIMTIMLQRYCEKELEKLWT